MSSLIRFTLIFVSYKLFSIKLQTVIIKIGGVIYEVAINDL